MRSGKNMIKQNAELDDKMTKVIDKKLLEVEQDDANGVKWLTREEADKLMTVNKELYV